MTGPADAAASCCAPARSATAQASPPLLTRATQVLDHGFVDIPGGDFLMGTDDPEGFPSDGEGPVRRVTLRPFLLARHAVTNDQFAAFVAATEYQTEAERFGFIAGYQKRTFGSAEQAAASVKAAQLMADLYVELEGSGYDEHEASVFLVRTLFALFADDS